jgi:hypothetical protein
MTTLLELRARLDQLRIHVEARGHRLHVKAPAGTLTPEIRTGLTDHKAELLATLGAQQTQNVHVKYVKSPSAPADQDEADQEDPPSWPPRPAELGRWPIPWRLAWGRLANKLEDEGLTTWDAEQMAFVEIKAAMQQALQAPPPEPEPPAAPPAPAQGSFDWTKQKPWGPAAGRPGKSAECDERERQAIQEEARIHLTLISQPGFSKNDKNGGAQSPR